MGNVIACLGWGSLIWDLQGSTGRNLPVEKLKRGAPVPHWVLCPEGDDVGDWKTNGPLVKVEFVRRSKCRICNTNACKRGPLTLVLYDKAAEQPSLWARMTKEVDTPEAAVSALAEREGITGNADKNIGLWSKTSDDKDPLAIPGLRRWATEQDIEHVVWTALGSKFVGNPNEDRVIEYLSNLSGDHRKRAEKYVRCAPCKIDTAYRRRIKAELDWSSCGVATDST